MSNTLLNLQAAPRRKCSDGTRSQWSIKRPRLPYRQITARRWCGEWAQIRGRCRSGPAAADDGRDRAGACRDSAQSVFASQHLRQRHHRIRRARRRSRRHVCNRVDCARLERAVRRDEQSVDGSRQGARDLATLAQRPSVSPALRWAGIHPALSYTSNSADIPRTCRLNLRYSSDWAASKFLGNHFVQFFEIRGEQANAFAELIGGHSVFVHSPPKRNLVDSDRLRCDARMIRR